MGTILLIHKKYDQVLELKDQTGWYLFKNEDNLFFKIKDHIRVTVKNKSSFNNLKDGTCYLGKLEFLNHNFYPDVICLKLYEIKNESS